MIYVNPYAFGIPLNNSLSIALDGVDENVVVADNAVFNPANNFSFCCWLKYPAATSKSVGGIVDKYVGSVSGYATLFNGTAGNIRFLAQTGAGQVNVFTSANLASNTWGFLAAVHDGSNIKLSLNGAAFTSTASGNVLSSSGHDLNLGGDGVSTLYNPIRIDLFSFWNVALSLAEINALMGQNDARLHSQAANLVCFIPVGEATGDSAAAGGTLTDIVGGFNGTCQNTEAADLVADVH